MKLYSTADWPSTQLNRYSIRKSPWHSIFGVFFAPLFGQAKSGKGITNSTCPNGTSRKVNIRYQTKKAAQKVLLSYIMLFLLALNPSDIRSQSLQTAINILIASVDLVDILNHTLAFCRQSSDQ